MRERGLEKSEKTKGKSRVKQRMADIGEVGHRNATRRIRNE